MKVYVVMFISKELEPKRIRVFESEDQAKIYHQELENQFGSKGKVVTKIRNTHNRFLDLLRGGHDLQCDLIIGDCDMPASFVWDEDSIITDYGVEKYKPIMEAGYKILSNGNIEIFCDDWKLGEQFCWAAAGYIGCSEYDKIFGKEEF